jgi:hypothetical protein
VPNDQHRQVKRRLPERAARPGSRGLLLLLIAAPIQRSSDPHQKPWSQSTAASKLRIALRSSTRPRLRSQPLRLQPSPTYLLHSMVYCFCRSAAVPEKQVSNPAVPPGILLNCKQSYRACQPGILARTNSLCCMTQLGSCRQLPQLQSVGAARTPQQNIAISTSSYRLVSNPVLPVSRAACRRLWNTGGPSSQMEGSSGSLRPMQTMWCFTSRQAICV